MFPTAWIAVCGAVWGLSLIRVLALTAHWAFALGWGGALVGALAGAGIAVALAPHIPAAAGYPLLLPALDGLLGGGSDWRGPVLLLGSLALTAALARSRPLPRRVILALAVLLPLAVYLPDISPYVGRADTFEFQVVAPRLGIAHPSGYPLYILIGKLFSLLPVSSIAWRINLSSAIFGALASGMLYLTLRALLACPLPNPKCKTHHLIPLLAALTLAFSPTLWARAIEAEVYTLNTLLVALALWLMVAWSQDKLPSDRALPLLGLLTGVGIASHLTLGALALLVAPLALARKPRPRTWLLAMGLGLAGMAIYLYIPLRWPALHEGAWMSLDHFFRFVTNAESGGALHPWAFIQDPPRWTLVFRLVRLQVTLPGMLLAALGLGWLARHHWPLALGSLLAFGAWVWFNLSFYVAEPDYAAFLIPGHVVVIAWLGIGAQSLFRWLHKRAAWSLPLALTALALLPLSRLWITGPTLDTLAEGREDEAWGRYVLAQPITQGAAILADSEKFPPLYYLQQMAGLRPDLDLVMRFDEAQYRADLDARLTAGQAVYLARYLPGMDAYGVESVGPLVRVGVSPPASPPSGGLEEGLTLIGQHLEPDPEGRPLHHLTLTWGVTAPVTEDLEVRLRLMDGEAVVWRNEATRPIQGYSSTQTWHPGDVRDDYHALRWPAWIAPGDYTLDVALFPRFGDAPVGDWHALGTVSVPRQAPPPPPRAYDALFANRTWLLGADFPAETWAGAALTLDVIWRTPPDTGTPVLVWQRMDAGERSARALAALTSPPQDGAPALTRYRVRAPDAPGRYHLALSWRDNGVPLPARCGWLQPPRAACPLGEIVVGPSAAGLANFADAIVLLDAEINAGDVPAGGQLAVTLTWRGLRAIERNYTVFVQALGPDGQVYGQADSWPVQGARPTGGWSPGEEVVDAYRFYLREGTPPGEYRVIVGWYLLADMSRLPVMDAGGRTVGDFYDVGGFTLGE